MSGTTDVVREVLLIMCGISALMVAGLALKAIAAWYEVRVHGGDRIRYVRAPLFIGCMVISYIGYLVPQTILAYVIVGVTWGLILPIRMMIHRKIVRKDRQFDWSMLADPGLWAMAGFLAVVHGLLWPISVPGFYFLGNEIGASPAS